MHRERVRAFARGARPRTKAVSTKVRQGRRDPADLCDRQGWKRRAEQREQGQGAEGRERGAGRGRRVGNGGREEEAGKREGERRTSRGKERILDSWEWY